MAKFETELLKRLPAYQAEGVLDEANARRLEAHIKQLSPTTQNAIFKNALYILGSALICLGLILAIAYNWDALPKELRIAMAFTPLSISAALSLYAVVKNKGAAWREVSAMLNIAGTAAMISMLSQIFQIIGDLKQFLLSIMALSALPMMAVMRSHSAAVILAILASVYVWPFYYSDVSPNTALAAGAFAAALGFALCRYKSAGYLQLGSVWAICTMSAAFIPVAVAGEAMLEELAMPIFFGICAAMSLLASCKYFDGLPKLPVSFMGIIGFLAASIMLNFDSSWMPKFPDIATYGVFNAPALLFFGVCALWTALLITALSNKRRNFGLVSSAMFFPYILLIIAYHGSGVWHVPLSNLITFACGFLFFTKGFKDQSARVMNLGLGIILFLAIVKFASDDLPMLVRAAMLAGAGIFLIAANIFLGKRKASA